MLEDYEQQLRGHHLRPQMRTSEFERNSDTEDQIYKNILKLCALFCHKSDTVAYWTDCNHVLLQKSSVLYHL